MIIDHMEASYLPFDKTLFFLSSKTNYTTIEMHCMNANKMLDKNYIRTLGVGLNNSLSNDPNISDVMTTYFPSHNLFK